MLHRMHKWLGVQFITGGARAAVGFECGRAARSTEGDSDGAARVLFVQRCSISFLWKGRLWFVFPAESVNEAGAAVSLAQIES